MSSNLPPGCSSPDGGIDHAWENAADELLRHLESPEHIKAMLKFTAVVRAVMEESYQLGYIAGRNEQLIEQLDEALSGTQQAEDNSETSTEEDWKKDYDPERGSLAVCPRCGSTRVTSDVRPGIAYRWECEDCGHKSAWRQV